MVFLLNVSGGTPPYSFAWTFADGSTSSVREPVHTYPSEGSFQVTVTVGESSGSNVSASVRVTVTRTQAPLWAAKEGRYFEQYGIKNLEVIQFSAGQPVTRALIGNYVRHYEAMLMRRPGPSR